jgi:hypothetical protein
MKNWINTHYKSLIIGAFLIPIITVAIVSISHVTKWYGISNPFSWAIYLSIGVEIAALSALAAISADMGKKVYFPFVIVTLIQFIGNIFFAHSYIDINSTSFKDWVDLVSPLVSFMGVEEGDFVGHKRFLALFAGGMLPIISLSFLHMLVKFTEEDRKKGEKIFEQEVRQVIDDGLTIEKEHQEQNKINAGDLIGEVSRIRLTEDELKKLEEVLLSSPPNENLKSAPEEQKKSIFPEEVEYPEEYNRPVYPTKEEIKDILSEMMRLDQELGLYDIPEVKENINEIETIPPALSDEEIKEMFMDEWDKKFDLVEDPQEDEMSIEEVMEKYPENFRIIDKEDFSVIDPSVEDQDQNFSTIEPISENIFQEEEIPAEIIPVDVAIDNQPEIDLEVKDPTPQNEDVEKKNQ